MALGGLGGDRRPGAAGNRGGPGASRGRLSPNLPRQVEFGDWPTRWSVATELRISDDGKVWARRAVHGDERQHWTEVDLDGPLRRHVILPERFSLRAIAGGRLYGVARDDMDLPRVATLALR